MPETPKGAGDGGPMVTLTVRDVAATANYTERRIRELVRQGRFPQPIDPTLKAWSWRWSPLTIAAYVAGEWTSSGAA